MKLSTLIGVSAAITGAVAITGNSSDNSSTTNYTVPNITYEPGVPDVPNDLFNYIDQVWVSEGLGPFCNETIFGVERFMSPGECKTSEASFTNLRSRVIPGKGGALKSSRCVLVTFSDDDCADDGAVIQQLSNPEEDIEPSTSQDCLNLYLEKDGELIEAESFQLVCGEENMDDDWVDPFKIRDDDDDDDQLISARSVDAELSRDHVTVAPADGLNCNSAQHRDTDTKVHGHCHSFDKPFSSLSATIKRAGHSKVGGSEPCSVLVFSDMDCTKDGAQVVDLNDTGALGVCHNFALHHGNGLGTAIAGHSWKWVCGRQEINDCINPKASKHHTKASTTSVKKGKTLTVTATTSLACSLTTEAAHSLDVITSVITHKPVTHTITSVFTKTQLRVRTKLITSVATAVSTVRHTVTKPFSTTYKVCDVEASSQS